MFQVTDQPGRLLLLVLLLAAPLSALPQQASAPAQKWRQSQKTDAARGISYTQFTLAGKFVKWPEKDAENRPSLEADCRTPEESGGLMEKFWHAYFFAGTPLTVQYVEPDAITTGISYFQKIDVRYRLDNGKEKKEQWSPGPDKSSVSIPKDVLKKMLGAHSVEMSVNEVNAKEVSAQFEMPDSSEVAQACGLGYHKK
jgi:hypothetical protein